MTPEEQTSLHKELELVQAVITRMASNSFSVKGWTYAITGGVLGLTKDIFFKPGASMEVIFLCLFLLIIIISLWYLDAYFLMTERQYRELYGWLVDARMSGNMEHKYCLNPSAVMEIRENIKSKSGLNEESEVMNSKTLNTFYLPLSILIVVLCILHFFITL